MTTQAAQGATIDKRETSEVTFAGTPTNGRAPDFLALSQEAVQALPTAIYTTDAEGRITFYNEAAAALWGCRPELGKSEFCGSWKLYWPDGTPLPRDECPMAMALQQRRPIRGMEALAERPDGTRIPFIPYPTPLFDASGQLTGAVNTLIDISERKRTEAALKNRDAQFELVSRIALIGSYSYDYHTRTLHLSQGCAAIYGLREDVREITQKDWRALVHPDDLSRIDATCLQALAQRRSELVLEFRTLRSDGKERWIEARILVSYDDAGRAVQMIGANIDVTKRKQTAQALAERTVQLDLAGKAARVGSYAYDTDTEIMQISEGYASIHGLPEGSVEVARSDCLATVHPDDIGQVKQLRSEAFDARRREYSVEYRIFAVSGEVRWVESRCFISYGEGRPHRVVGVSIDITERKQLEGALQRNERKFRELLEALPAAIYVTDADGYVSYCNQAAVDLWGTRPRFGEDRWCDLARFYSRDGVPMPVEDCPTEIALSQGRSVRTVEAILERLDGTRIPIMPYPTPVYDGAGAVVGVINMTVDISDRKASELALAERNIQLDLAGKVALVGTFTFDVATGRMQVSPGYAAIHGLPERTEDSSRADWRARVHPEDLARLETRFEQTVAARRSEHHCDYRIVRPDGDVRWIESRSFISYDGDGPRLVGANIDVTNRKSAERALDERNMQLSLAGKAAGVGSYAYDLDAYADYLDSDVMQVTEGYAALHGLPEGTTETTRSQWRARAHPEDLVHVEAARRQAFRERRNEYGIEYRIVRPGGEVRWIESRSLISYNEDGRPQRLIGFNIDVTERRRAEDHQRVLIAELDHRVKNVLATVAAVAANARETSSSMQHFVAAIDARIRALAFTHELLSTRRWQGLPLHELLRRQLAPYAGSNNTHIDGPDVLLTPEAGQAVGMVLHELATNAAKYGALSVRTGRVSVQWSWSQCDGLVIKWQETGGPDVKAPGTFGYGTSVINHLIPYELGGKVDCEFPHTGVRCRLDIPATWAISSLQPSRNLNGAGSAPSRAHAAVLIGGAHG